MATIKICEDNGMTPSFRDVEQMGRNMPVSLPGSAPTPMAGASNIVPMSGDRGFGFTDAQGVHIPLPKTTPPPEKFFG